MAAAQRIEIVFSAADRQLIRKLISAIENQNPPVVHNHFDDTVDREFYRDAVTGEYVTRAYAEAHPDTTVKETSPVIPHE